MTIFSLAIFEKGMTDQNTNFHFNSRFSGGNILHDLENYMHSYVGIHWIIVLYQWLLVVVYLHVLVLKGSFDLCELYMIYWGCFGRWYFSRHYVAASFLYQLQCLGFLFSQITGKILMTYHTVPIKTCIYRPNVWCVALKQRYVQTNEVWRLPSSRIP